MTFHFDHITYVVKSPAVNAILIVLMGLRHGMREEAPFAPSNEGPYREVWIVLVSAKWTALGRNKKGSKSWRQSKPH